MTSTVEGRIGDGFFASSVPCPPECEKDPRTHMHVPGLREAFMEPIITPCSCGQRSCGYCMHAAGRQYERDQVEKRFARDEHAFRLASPGSFQHEGEPAEGKKASNPKDIIGSGKAPLSLVPASLRAGAAMAFLEGALKYGRFNWRLAGVRASIYYDALQRHMDAWFNGEDIDEASGLPHLYKAAACIAILIDATEIDKLVDDRAPYAAMSPMFDRLSGEVTRLKKARLPQQTEPHQCVLADSPGPRQVAAQNLQWQRDVAPGCGEDAPPPHIPSTGPIGL